MTQPGLALILSGFPRRSETFALHEATALLRAGLLTAVFATKPGDGLPPQPGSEALLAQVQLLPAGDTALQAAAVLHQLAGRPVAGVHAYFAHTPTAVAMRVAQQLGMSYGFSMHAKDARKVAPSELNRRARGAVCVVACNRDVAGAITDPAAAVTILPHGVDLLRFQPTPLPAEPPLRLLAVGRLVEKKGFDLLVRAAAGFTFPFTLEIIGDGPEQPHLIQLISSLGLQGQITLRGGVTHSELPARYAAAHIVVVPSVVDRTGDRDGLPNVLLEAMAAGRPVVASDVAAISSAVIDGESGLLLPSGDIAALTMALNRLAAAPELRHTLARNGYRRVVQHFALSACTDRFCDFIAKRYAL
ncbi:MAG: colanic acid biosynthesis glycosyltransferase WcaL [Caldilinea sp. CFX5]|nr:colanic acid biosynthesis glycosyltransferase WcaL [Caldilinea sp. CFX5]